MHKPTSAASLAVRDRSAFVRHHRNAGKAAAATRLKCPVVRATMAGAHAKTSPARNASGRDAAVARRAGLPVYGLVAHASSHGDGLQVSVPAPGEGVLSVAGPQAVGVETLAARREKIAAIAAQMTLALRMREMERAERAGSASPGRLAKA